MNSAGPNSHEASVDAVVFDLDGVIRHWNDDELDRAARQHGVPPGAILEVAFSAPLGRAAITGRLTYREWMDRIRAEIIGDHGPGAEPALTRWEQNVGIVDREMVELLRIIRNQVPVALLSNGTTRLRRDLHVLELTEEFDVIFNTAEIGVAKPDPAVFQEVLGALGTDARRTAFVDDLPTNVAGARQVGLAAHRFEGRPGTEAFLRRLGLAL
ncbi:MAG: HAD-IA family hydrolase [Microthrixaceae bacterium]